MEGLEDADTLQPAAGTLLVASPKLLDPNFMHTVVLLCEHGPEGSYGLILNRPGDFVLSDLGSDAPLLRGREDRVWFGGPVQVEHLQLLHRRTVPVPDSIEIVPGVRLGGDPDALCEALTGCDPDSVRFLVGYSGWGAKQLEAEMGEGAWVVCPARPEIIFDEQPETLWRRVLRGRGGAIAGLADIPPDPSWN
jgi:putative transcriptional regulator